MYGGLVIFVSILSGVVRGFFRAPFFGDRAAYLWFAPDPVRSTALKE